MYAIRSYYDVYRGIDFSPAIDNGAAKFGWKEKWKGWGRPTSVDGNKRRGVGVGIHSNADVGEDDSEAWVTLTPAGRALVCAAISESGQGQRRNRNVSLSYRIPTQTPKIVITSYSIHYTKLYETISA